MITLTEQMQQKTNLRFQNILHRAKNEDLNKIDVNVLNKQIIENLSFANSSNNVIVVQQNNLRYIINRFQIQRVVQKPHKFIIIFFVEHFRIIKNRKILLIHENLFDFQNEKNKMNKSKLIYYCKNM